MVLGSLSVSASSCSAFGAMERGDTCISSQKTTQRVTHENECDLFLVYLSSLDLSATSPRTLLEGTCSELLPRWDAVRRVLGRLHWNYK